MIPAPPPGELSASIADEVVAALVPGILAGCCACGLGTIWHWHRDPDFVPLHPHCVARVVDSWREAIASGQVDTAPPTGQLTGAYARRAAARGGDAGRHRRVVSIGQGSRFFVPGMFGGTPWVAVAVARDGAELICPCGKNATHAREVNQRYRALATLGIPAGGGFAAARSLRSGHVLDPTGAVFDAWTV